jgi:hydrogenase maturation protein HypF
MTAPTTVGSAVEGRRIEVRGLVQGVGYRPFVWRVAQRFGVSGSVRNDGGVVEIQAEGSADALDAFCAALRQETPPLARVESVVWSSAPSTGLLTFDVEGSTDDEGHELWIPADVATCRACLAELTDPDDRRFEYPFVNCTDCGPRYTIVEGLPYDRERTTMRAFPLCPACGAEYGDPADRRFHAEPVACPACGPVVSLLEADGHAVTGSPIEEAATRLRSGAIVAVKGLGGFHLACDATDEAAVARLRERKARPRKPFAVMVADLDEARRLFDVDASAEAALASWRAPIVLVRDRGLLAPSVAPGHRRQGAMLPGTPLHHLLLRAADRPLVMTSGNRSEEPICIDDPEALGRLGQVADAFLIHDREILARCDDSVVRPGPRSVAVLRRARGYVPEPIPILFPGPPVLGTGAELNATFCLANGDLAYLSPHVGDLDSEETLAAYRTALDHYRDVFRVEPELVAHDLHPDFLTTRFALDIGLPTVAVQHHHAHVAAVMAEHALTGPVLGVAFDGFGLGEDGQAWGGEFLEVRPDRAHRVGHLRGVRLPGGDAAVRRPVRVALAHALDAGCADRVAERLGVDERDLELVRKQVESGLNSPVATSAGRLFDAVAALTGAAEVATYDGEPAILLEQLASPSATAEYPYDLYPEGDRLVVDTRPVVGAVVHDLLRGIRPSDVAGRFHRTLAGIILAECRVLRISTGISTVCLGGGVFHNDLLTSDVVARLRTCDFEVFVPAAVPAGDGGISLGQALVARARAEEG